MNECDPKKIIDFDKDYYEILGIDKTSFPSGKTRENKIAITRLLEKAFRQRARKCHPDFGGSKEQFLDIVRARRILEDDFLRRVYDQGYFEENKVIDQLTGFEIDWDKVGTYRNGTPEDTVGYSLFLKICEAKENLNITPAFRPTTNEHNYVWDFVINDESEKITKLTISIVNDESEVLRLTSGENIEKSLPFKIYICIPKAGLHMSRSNNASLSPNGKIMANASISYISYQDIDLLETTILDEAHEYVKNLLGNDLISFKKGDLSTKTKANTNWLDTDKLKEFDQMKLSNILNMKSFIYKKDEKAADFIDKLPE